MVRTEREEERIYNLFSNAGVGRDDVYVVHGEEEEGLGDL